MRRLDQSLENSWSEPPRKTGRDVTERTFHGTSPQDSEAMSVRLA